MTVDAIGPSHYTDVQGLNTLRTQARAQDPEALRSTAKQFETIFTKMMLQSMRDARLGEDIFGSSAGDMYQSMFDDQIALEMSRGQGIGIAEMLLEQLKRGGSPTPLSTSPTRVEPDHGDAGGGGAGGVDEGGVDAGGGEGGAEMVGEGVVADAAGHFDGAG